MAEQWRVGGEPSPRGPVKMVTTPVRAPNGVVIQVKHPEGITDNEIKGYARAQFYPEDDSQRRDVDNFTERR